jgi:hypothetical protein
VQTVIENPKLIFKKKISGGRGSLECPRGPKPSRKDFIPLFTVMGGKKEIKLHYIKSS